MISNEFNASSGNFHQTAKTLKAKYETAKKNLRKECSSIRREQAKTGGGVAECSGINAFEEKVMSMTECSMIGMPARFDNDNSESNLVLVTNEVECIEDDDVLDSLKNQGEISVDDADLITTEELPAGSSTNTLDQESPNGEPRSVSGSPTHFVRTARTQQPALQNNINSLTDNQNKTSFSSNLQVQKPINKLNKMKNNTSCKISDLNIVYQEQKQADPNSFTKIKRLTGAGHHAEMIKLKKEVLMLQKPCLEMEKEKKRRIHDLIISNLEMDLKVKEMKLQKLRTNVSDEDGDEEPNTNYSQYLDST